MVILKWILKRLFLAGLILIWVVSCSIPEKEKTVKIAISKAQGSEGYERYGKWLKMADPSIEFFDLYFISLDSALKIFEQCNGLLITGGTDVSPLLYGKTGDTSRCEPPDHRRDSLEILLIRRAIEKKMPLLGICRGEQIINVALGGSLVIDIPSDFDTLISHRCGLSDTCYHQVDILPGCLLYQVTGTASGRVISSHHQAVSRPANGLLAVARAPDGLPEAIQWADTSGKSFLLGVQWHPERMDTANPLSLPIARYFIQQARNFGKKAK